VGQRTQLLFLQINKHLTEGNYSFTCERQRSGGRASGGEASESERDGQQQPRPGAGSGAENDAARQSGDGESDDEEMQNDDGPLCSGFDLYG
jgi:hypothetical protein